MDELKFDREALVKVLKENRDKHRDAFEVAVAGYEDEAVIQLQRMLERVKAGKRPHVMVNMPVPQDHTRDYDRVIRMLEMTTTEPIELAEHEFSMYVMDDWAWKGQWTTSNAGYTATGSAKLGR